MEESRILDAPPIKIFTVRCTVKSITSTQTRSIFSIVYAPTKFYQNFCTLEDEFLSNFKRRTEKESTTQSIVTLRSIRTVPPIYAHPHTRLKTSRIAVENEISDIRSSRLTREIEHPDASGLAAVQSINCLLGENRTARYRRAGISFTARPFGQGRPGLLAGKAYLNVNNKVVSHRIPDCTVAACQ